MWRQVLVTVLATLAVASSLTVGPISLVNDNRFINYTKGASPENSLLRCSYTLEGEEEVSRVIWELKDNGEVVGTFTWQAGASATATGVLQGVADMARTDAELLLTELRYDLSGEYSCRVILSNGEEGAAAPWEVLILDSVSHLSTLKATVKECSYTTSYSTLAMFPTPEVHAGLYSVAEGGFYKEIPKSAWLSQQHENGSFTQHYTNYTFVLDSRTPEDISFTVTVGVRKGDGNYIPVSSAMDKHLILHHLGCPEPRLEEYQNISFHRDTVTCRGEHKDTEATVTCKKGFRADGPVDAVLVRCEESTHTWVLEDGTAARREHLGCVIDNASGVASLFVALLGAALVFLRLSSL